MGNEQMMVEEYRDGQPHHLVLNPALPLHSGPGQVSDTVGALGSSSVKQGQYSIS